MKIFCCRERWTEGPVGIRMDKRDVGGLPNNKKITYFARAMARFLLLLPRSSASHKLIFSPLNAPPPHNLPGYLQTGWRWRGDVSLAGFFFGFFSSSSSSEGKNEVLRRRWWTEISKWCSLFVLFSTHSRPFQSSPPSPAPPLSQSHQQ